jgi:hypothetical protein
MLRPVLFFFLGIYFFLWCGIFHSVADEFYSLLYLSLFCEACRSEPMKASMYMKQAIQTQYALRSNDYMVSLAKVNSNYPMTK